MELGQIIIIFISYAIIQSVYLIIKFLVSKKIKDPYSVFLILLLAVIIIICTDHLYMYFQWYKINPLMIWWVLPFWFLIAPLFYHTIKFFFLGYSFKYIELLHYTPILFLIWPYKASFLTPKEIKLEYYSVLMNQGFEPGEPHYLLLLQLILYAFTCLILIKKTVKIKKQIDSNSTYEDYIISFRLVLLYFVFIIVDFLVIL